MSDRTKAGISRTEKGVEKIKDGDVVKWTYTEDVCSKMVDKR
jgi:hypothetical protein